MSVLQLSEYQYHSDAVDPDRPSLSRSIIQKLVQKTPAHAFAAHPRLNPLWAPEDKSAFDVGTVAHSLLLGIEQGVQALPYDSWRTNAAKDERDKARAHGLVPLLEHQWVEVQAMMDAVDAQLSERPEPFFADGDPEVTLSWEENGVLCRARLDWLTHDRAHIKDFKTSRNAEPFKFSRGSFFDYGYDLQAAWYTRGVRACFGTDPTYELAVVEKEAPYSLIVFDCGPDVLALANAKIEWAVGVWRECLETGRWPGYSSATHSVTVPPWIEEQWWRKFEAVPA